MRQGVRKHTGSDAGRGTTLKTSKGPSQQSQQQGACCDVCIRKDGFRGLRLQQCRTCGVQVHDMCYGMQPTESHLEDWQCWACQAVGDGHKIEGRHLARHAGGGRRVQGHVQELTQASRPLECALCSVADGIHAMHPLYDAPKRKGRQVILPADDARKKPERLAWVHTLCAMAVSEYRGTSGCVYGCDEDGNYDSDEEDNDDEEETETSPALSRRKDGSSSGKNNFASIHHFVIAGMDFVHPSSNEQNALWISTIRNFRELQCFVCGRLNQPRPDLRIPIQCCAGDDREFEEFKEIHGNDPCYQGMHVGCAMWGTKNDPPEHRRVWFYPGKATVTTEGYDDPVGEVFCSAHASDLFVGMKKKREGIQASLPRRRSSAKKDSGSTILQRVVESDSEEASALIWQASEVLSPSRKKSILSLPLKITKPSAGISLKKIATKVASPREACRRSGLEGPGKKIKKRKMVVEEGNADDNASESGEDKMSRNVAQEKTNDLHEIPKKKISSDGTVLERMVRDVEQVVQAKDDQSERRKHIKERRLFWKKDAGLSKAEFKENWRKLQDLMLQRYPNLPSGRENGHHSGEDEQDVDDEQASLQQEDERETGHPPPAGEDPWAYLWLPNAEPFAFGEWDSFKKSRHQPDL